MQDAIWRNGETLYFHMCWPKRVKFLLPVLSPLTTLCRGNSTGSSGKPQEACHRTLSTATYAVSLHSLEFCTLLDFQSSLDRLAVLRTEKWGTGELAYLPSQHVDCPTAWAGVHTRGQSLTMSESIPSPLAGAQPNCIHQLGGEKKTGEGFDFFVRELKIGGYRYYPNITMDIQCLIWSSQLYILCRYNAFMHLTHTRSMSIYFFTVWHFQLRVGGRHG